MSDAQLRLGTLMALGLLGIATLMYFWEPEEKPADAAATVTIWNVEPEQVTRVDLMRPGGNLSLEKDGDDWRITSPVQFAADTYKVKDLIESLASAKKGVPVVGTDPATYGLGSPPEAQVTLTTRDGRSFQLAVGVKTPVGGKTYVRAPDGTIVATDGDLGKDLAQTAEDLRDETVVSFQVSHVVAVKLEEAAGTLDISKDAHGWWLKGYNRADPYKVEDLLMAARDLRFERFAPDGTALPEAAETLTIAFDDGTSRVLRFGRPEPGEGTSPDGTPDPGKVMVQVDGGLAGYVGADGTRFLSQGPTDVADKHAFPVDQETATHLDVTLGGTSWTLDKPGESWQRAGKDEPAAEKALDALDKADTVYEPGVAPAIGTLYGAITVREGDHDRVVQVGQVSGDWRVCQDKDGGEPYFAKASDIDDIAHALDAPAAPPNLP